MRTTIIGTSIAIATAIGCGGPENDEAESIESWIDDLGTREAEAPRKVITPMADPMPDGDYTCSRERYAVLVFCAALGVSLMKLAC